MLNKSAELEKKVIGYNNGEDMAEEILSLFKGFLNKFQSLICDGKVNFDNAPIRKFIGLFIEKGYDVHKYKKSPTVIVQSCKAARLIKNIFDRYEREDIEHTLICTVLEIARKYEPIDEKPRFSSYFAKTFPFELYHKLNQEVKDPLHYCSLEGMQFNEKLVSYDEELLVDDFSFLKTEEDNLVDENWIAGFTSDILDFLNPVEKRILKMQYVDKMTDSEIAEYFGVCRATINRKRNKTESIIFDKLKKTKILKE